MAVDKAALARLDSTLRRIDRELVDVVNALYYSLGQPQEEFATASDTFKRQMIANEAELFGSVQASVELVRRATRAADTLRVAVAMGPKAAGDTLAAGE